MNKDERSNTSKNSVSDSSVNAGGNVHIGDVINIQQVVGEQLQPSGEQQSAVAIAGEIKNLIARNKVKQALEQFLLHTKNLDSDLHDDAILLSGRWNELQSGKRRGLLYPEQAAVQSNQIVQALLQLTGELS